MFTRTTATAASAVLTLTAAAVTLAPTAAHADPTSTYTGHVQVIIGTDVVGCVAASSASPSSHTTDEAAASNVSIVTGSQQDLTINDETGSVLGVDSSGAAHPISRTSMGYTFLTAGSPVPAGSSSVNYRQTAIWSVDPVTMELSADYVWDDLTSERVETWQYTGGSYVGLSPDTAAVASQFPEVTPATFRLGEDCSGDVDALTAQAITFTSSAPTPAYPGQTYAIAATGGASGNAVTFSSTTTDHCTIDGATVTFSAPGTCTIDANQAGATSYSAAPTVSQQVTVSAIPSTVDLALTGTSLVTGQTTTATAEVDVIAGSVSAAGGSVQFAVSGTDVGAPVSVDAAGKATSPALGANVGSHQVTGTYTPGDATNYAGSTGSAALTVATANTSTKVSVTASVISATVEPVAPGAGTPGGEVTFHVDGVKVGTATLNAGTAKLAYVVPADRARSVSAEYAGDTSFNGSSTSTSRTNPTITARVTSSQKARSGWYRTPVRVTFTCAAKGSELVTDCPAAVTVRRQGATSVTRTIRSADGGIATATGIVKVDTKAPRVRIKHVKAGRSYFDAPKPKCATRDTVSGVRTCKVTSKRSGNKVVVTAKASDRAGNVRTKRVSYRVTDYTIQGAKQVKGVWSVRQGDTYTILVRGAKPSYVYATPTPGQPRRGLVPFHAAGKNRWAVGVTMSMTTSHTRSWNLGYVQNGKTHVIRVRVSG